MSECDKCGEHAVECRCSLGISDYNLDKYTNHMFTEELLRHYEDQILSVMKHRQEKYPSEKNDKEWRDFSDFICERRADSL